MAPCVTTLAVLCAILIWFRHGDTHHVLQEIKSSRWNKSSEYANHVTQPALFISTSRSIVACTMSCCQAPNCDVITYTKSSRVCRGYTSNMTVPTTTPAHNAFMWMSTPAGASSTTSAPVIQDEIVMKRICADHSYTHVPSLHWCVSLKEIDVTWSEGQDTCELEGGRLAVLNSSDKRSYVFHSLNVYEMHVWVDGSRDPEGYGFVFSTGQHVDDLLLKDEEYGADCLSFDGVNLYSENCQQRYMWFLCEEIW